MTNVLSPTSHIDGFMQERRNSSALAMELHISYINPSIWWWLVDASSQGIIEHNYHPRFSGKFLAQHRNGKAIFMSELGPFCIKQLPCFCPMLTWTALMGQVKYRMLFRHEKSLSLTFFIIIHMWKISHLKCKMITLSFHVMNTALFMWKISNLMCKNCHCYDVFQIVSCWKLGQFAMPETC